MTQVLAIATIAIHIVTDQVHFTTNEIRAVTNRVWAVRNAVWAVTNRICVVTIARFAPLAEIPLLPPTDWDYAHRQPANSYLTQGGLHCS
jgi:hypothetical protein